MHHSNSITSVPIGLLRKYDRPGPRYTSYPTAPVWSDEVGPEVYASALKAASAHTDEPIALYIHIPFCRCRCYYCGCNTVITRNSEKVHQYIDTLLKEIDHSADLLGARNKVSQLHFGGGTPTFIEIADFARILDKLDSRFTFVDGCEKSLEIDPRVTTREQLAFLAGRGFNRISIGVQDLDPGVQEAIGRVQSVELIRNVMDQCRELKFKGINIDLIYGLPLQTLENFRQTLKTAIQLRPDSVAVYSFAYLPNVKSNQMKINAGDLPHTEDKYQLFASAIEEFTAAGYMQIGMDHFALPEDELSRAQSDGRLFRNFMGYTVQSAPEMLGLGMSSIGYVDDSFFQNYSSLDKYMEAVNSRRFATYRGMRLSTDDLIRQHVITSLMCNFRLDFETLRQKFSINYHEYFRIEHKHLVEFFEDDLLEEPNGGLKITQVGRTFIRNIAMTFDAYLDGSGGGKKPTFSRTI